MNLVFLIFIFFSSSALISAIMVILSKNPVNSVLFLVLTFCNVTSLLFTLELEFIPISFVVIYVGAIAVLFLFVIMMLNIKLAELKENNKHLVPIAIFFSLLFLSEILLIIQADFNAILLIKKEHLIFISEYTSMFFLNLSFIHWFLELPNISFIGQILFTEFAKAFVVAGDILLLAMLGAIILTLQKKFISKSQNIYTQVLRDFNSSIKLRKII